MNINFGKGLKRIYIVASLFWAILMIYVAVNELNLNQIYNKQISYTQSCDEIRNPGPAKQTGEGLQLNISKAMIDLIRIENRFRDVKVTVEKPCKVRYKMKLLQKLNPKNSEAYLYIFLGLAPIPIYYLLIFLIGGFREDKK